VSAESWSAALLESVAREAGAPIAVDADARKRASRDWGGLVEGDAVGVITPEDAHQLSKVVRFAHEHGLPLTVRSGGMSQSGQSVPRNGLSVSTRGLRGISPIVAGEGRLRVSVGPGATWREVLTAVGPGFVPPVVPLNLDLTVGGTLSAGGIGSTSHRHGPAAQHVASLDVVSGTGSEIRCGPSSATDLFACVLGGFGNFGVIASADIFLRRPQSQVRTYCLLYDRFEAFLGDQRRLVELDRFDHMEGFASAAVQGLRKGKDGRRAPFAEWFYGLHVSIEHEQSDPPDEKALLSGLQFSKLLHVEDDAHETFAARYDPRFEVMRMLGAWEQAHPWFECMLPLQVAESAIPRVLDRLPMFFGDGHRMTLIARADAIHSLAMPTRDPVLAFAVLPMGIHPRLCDRAMAVLEEVNDLLLAAGGKRYVSGWQFQPGEARWRAHYGDMYAAVAEVKARMDPRGILGSCLEFH
jgi:cytokinin dehydrogenase